jgi:ABC-type sugar transport system ATPase subunit
MLEVKNIVKNFKGVQALRDVSVKFYDGEIHGLVGENGAGKSTLMKIISGVYPPDSGSLELDGTPISFRTPIEAEPELKLLVPSSRCPSFTEFE